MTKRWPYRLYAETSVESGTVESGTVESGTVDSGTVESGTVEVGMLGRGALESSTVQPVAGLLPATAESPRRRVSIRRVSPDDPQRREKISPWVERLSWVLDEAIEIPGTGRRIGFDGLIGFIPVIGDSASLVAGFSVVVAALAAGVSTPTVGRMVLHIVIDEVFGAVPFIGRVWDFTYKANTRNLALFRSDVEDRVATRRSSTRVLLMSVAIAIVLIALAAALIAINLAALLWLLSKLGGS